MDGERSYNSTIALSKMIPRMIWNWNKSVNRQPVTSGSASCTDEDQDRDLTELVTDVRNVTETPPMSAGSFSLRPSRSRACETQPARHHWPSKLRAAILRILPAVVLPIVTVLPAAASDGTLHCPTRRQLGTPVVRSSPQLALQGDVITRWKPRHVLTTRDDLVAVSTCRNAAARVQAGKSLARRRHRLHSCSPDAKCNRSRLPRARRASCRRRRGARPASQWGTAPRAAPAVTAIRTARQAVARAA